MRLLTTPLLLSLSTLSSYALYTSYNNIQRLQRYESKMQKAAQWSGAAEEQLRKTRTTQGGAVVSISLSLCTSLILLLTTQSPFYFSSLALVNSAAVLSARLHMANFWQGKAKVPFVEGYNEAISGTAGVLDVLGWLGGAWGGVCLGRMVGL